MEIQLSNGLAVKISDADFRKVSALKLSPFKARNTTYAVAWKWNSATKKQAWKWNSATKKQTKVFLHRHLKNAKRGQMVCHLNGNGLDCRRRNMKFGNHHLNGCSFRTKRKGSASKYRGVNIYNGRGKRWSVQFIDNGVLVYGGRFANEVDAARRYNQMAKKRFGKFAHINFL